MTVSVNGRASAYSGFYAYAAPYVTEASALNSAVTGGVRLTLSGINFGVADPTPFVRLGGARVAPNRRPHPPLSASAPAPPLMHSAHSPSPKPTQCRKWLPKCWVRCSVLRQPDRLLSWDRCAGGICTNDSACAPARAGLIGSMIYGRAVFVPCAPD